MWRGDRRRAVAFAASKQRHEVARAHSPPTGRDQRADERADHLVAERTRLDLEAEHPTVERCPTSIDDPANDPARRAVRWTSAKGCEIVLADDRIRGEAKHREVELTVDVPDVATTQRVTPLADLEVIAVAAGRRRAPGVEFRRSDHCSPDDDARAAHARERAGETGDLGVDLSIDREPLLEQLPVDVDVDDLGKGMDTRVRSSGTGDLRLAADHPPDRRGDRSRNGPLPGLGGETVKTRAVVGDAEGDTDRQTNSTLAMGALSPGRGPSFKMRR